MFGIEISDPFLHVLMLFVIGVEESLKKFLVRKGAAYILRRCIAFAAYAERTDIVGIALRHFLKLQHMQPLVAEIIDVLDSITRGEIEVAQASGPVVHEVMLSIRIGDAIYAAIDVELMQVIV